MAEERESIFAGFLHMGGRLYRCERIVALHTDRRYSALVSGRSRASDRTRCVWMTAKGTRTTRTGSPGRGAVGMSAAWPIRTSSGSATTSTCTFWVRIARAGRRLGVARSHDGVTWQKYRGNPILELGAPGRFDEHGSGRAGRVVAARMVLDAVHGARSQGISASGPRAVAGRRDIGSRVSEQPVLSGTQAWNSKVVCDPTVLLDGDLVRVWFGGGDKAEPAENLNGQIGYATLKLTLTP